MTPMKLLLTAAAVAFAMPAVAGTITVKDPYARVSTAMSKSGAVFMVIGNTGDVPDRLLSASADVSAVAQLHTHKEDANGVVHMNEVPDGFAIPAHGEHALKRGGDHVMLMGLNTSLKQGDVVHLTLDFEKAGKLSVDAPVDLKRGQTGTMDMGN